MKLLAVLLGLGLVACISAYGDSGYDREDKGVLNPAAEPSAPTRPRNRKPQPHPSVIYQPFPGVPIAPAPRPGPQSYGPPPKQESSYSKSESDDRHQEKAPAPQPIYSQSSYTVHLEPFYVTPAKAPKKDDGYSKGPSRPSYEAPEAQGYHAHSAPAPPVVKVSAPSYAVTTPQVQKTYEAPEAQGYHAHSAPAPPTIIKVPAPSYAVTTPQVQRTYEAVETQGHRAHSAPVPPTIIRVPAPSYTVTTPQVHKSVFQIQATSAYPSTTSKPKSVAKPTVRPVFIPAAYQPVQTLYPLQFVGGAPHRPAYQPQRPQHDGKGSEEEGERKKQEEEEEEEEEEEGDGKGQKDEGKDHGEEQDGGYYGSGPAAPDFKKEAPFPAFNVHAPAFPAFPAPVFPAYRPEAPAAPAPKPKAPAPTPVHRPQPPVTVPSYKPQVTVTLPAYQPQRPSFPAYRPQPPAVPAYRPHVTEAPAYPQQTVTDFRVLPVHVPQAPSVRVPYPAGPSYGGAAEPEVQQKEEEEGKREEEFYPDDLSAIPGEPGKDYPQMALIPHSSFTCENKIPGYYADLDTQCQVWHFCDTEYRKESFLCPNGTIYNQEAFVCDWWYNVDCSKAANYYGLNEELYKVPIKKVEIEASGPQYEQKSQQDGYGSGHVQQDGYRGGHVQQDGYRGGHVQQSTYQTTASSYQVSQPSYVVSVPAIAVQKPFIYAQPPPPVKTSKKSKSRKSNKGSSGYEQEKSQSKKSRNNSGEDSHSQGY